MKMLPAIIGALALTWAPSTALAQYGAEDYIIIGGDDEPDEVRWIYTWWDERGVFHGVDSLDLVPTVYRDRAERTQADDAIRLGVFLEKSGKIKDRGGQQRLRPNLPQTDRRAQGETTARAVRRPTQAEQERKRSERLTLLRTQLRAVEEQLGALEEGTVPTEADGDLSLTDAQLDARLTHLETRFDYLTSEIEALSKGT